MSDVRFEIELRWSGTGRAGAGQILTDVGAIEVREAAGFAMASDESRPLGEHVEAAREGAGPRSPDERTAGAAT
jgi:hypothetical protein